MSLYFLFVQFEFTHAVGPHAARYVVAADTVPNSEGRNGRGFEALDPGVDTRNRELVGTTRGVGADDVLVVGVKTAPAAVHLPRLLRRPRDVEPGAEPPPVSLSVLTFIAGSNPITSRKDAAARLEAIRHTVPEQNAWVTRGLVAVNTAIRAYRLGAPDPYTIEVTRRDARATRIGYGSTEQVGDGKFEAAIELPSAPTVKTGRYERLLPAEAVAAVLAGRHRMLESEDVLSRVLLDLDGGRTRAAANQAAAGMRLLRSEVYQLPEHSRPDLAKLANHSRQALQIADAANAGPLGDNEVQELENIVYAVSEILGTWRDRQPA